MVRKNAKSGGRLAGVAATALGLALLWFFTVVYTGGPGSEYSHRLSEALVGSFLAPILIVWGVLAIWTGSYRPLTPLRTLPMPVIALGTYVRVDQLMPNRGFVDHVGPGTPSLRDPSIADSVVEVLVEGEGALVAALCLVLVGVVLARHGGYVATVSLAVPLAVAMVYPVTTGRLEDVAWQFGRIVLFGWLPFAVGYFAAADLDEDAEPISRWLPGVAARAGADGDAE